MPVTLRKHELKEVEYFTYLGSLVTATGGTHEQVKPRIENLDTVSMY